jgi:uncharacterized membrane protein YkvA (DUF1232 family)
MRSRVGPAGATKQCPCRNCCSAVAGMNKSAESGRRSVKRLISRAKTWARALRLDAHAIYLASGDPRVPWAAKLLAVAVAGYALSPIDLIPDFIPVLGVLDDLIIVPLGIWLVIELIPEDVMREYRAMASAAAARPVSKAAAIIIVALWISGAALLGWMAFVTWRV